MPSVTPTSTHTPLPRATGAENLHRNASHGSITSLVALSFCSDKSWATTPYCITREQESITNIINESVTCPHCTADFDLHEAFEDRITKELQPYRSDRQPVSSTGHEVAQGHKNVLSSRMQPATINLDATISSLDQTLQQLGLDLKEFHLQNPGMRSIGNDHPEPNRRGDPHLRWTQVDGPADQSQNPHSRNDHEIHLRRLGLGGEDDQGLTRDGTMDRSHFPHAEFTDMPGNGLAAAGLGRDATKPFSLFSDASNLEHLVGSNARLLRTLQNNINRALQYHHVLASERDQLAKERQEVQDLKRQLQRKLHAKEVAAICEAEKDKDHQPDEHNSRSIRWASRVNSSQATKERPAAEDPDAIFEVEDLVASNRAAANKPSCNRSEESLDSIDASPVIEVVVWTEDDESLYNHLLSKLKRANRQWSPEQEEILEQLEPLKERRRLYEKARKRKMDWQSLYKAEGRMARSSSDLGSSPEKKTRSNSFSLFNGLKRNGSKSSAALRRTSTASSSECPEPSPKETDDQKEKSKSRFSRILKG